MLLCLKRHLKRRNAWFWRFKQRFKHRNASGFGVFDICGAVRTAREVHAEQLREKLRKHDHDHVEKLKHKKDKD